LAARRGQRDGCSCNIKDSFAISGPLTVHWDGKRLSTQTRNKTADRLAILVSGDDNVKLLAVREILHGTGEAQAQAVFKVLQDWQLTGQVQFMSFDTTASNAGRKAGACILLQQMLQRKLVSLPCRHHIHELIVEKVFQELMPPSTDPNIQLFQRFSAAWTKLSSTKLSILLVWKMN